MLPPSQLHVASFPLSLVKATPSTSTHCVGKDDGADVVGAEDGVKDKLGALDGALVGVGDGLIEDVGRLVGDSVGVRLGD